MAGKGNVKMEQLIITIYNWLTLRNATGRKESTLRDILNSNVLVASHLKRRHHPKHMYFSEQGSFGRSRLAGPGRSAF